jgi:hypothetical protein
MATVRTLSIQNQKAEVIEHLLHKGVVIETWVVVSFIGLQLLTIEARVVAASLEAYLRYADGLGKTMFGTPLQRIGTEKSGQPLKLTLTGVAPAVRIASDGRHK